MNWSLDFSRPEAAAYVCSMLREVVERYAPVMDGLQLDWMRFPRHLSGVGDEVWAKREHLTRIVEMARELTKAHGLKLAVRVPSTPRGCRVVGIDVADWVKRGLVDFVTVSEFLDTDYEMPIGEFRAMFDLYNLFNANSTTFEEPAFGSFYLQPQVIMPGRLGKFSFQFDF